MTHIHSKGIVRWYDHGLKRKIILQPGVLWQREVCPRRNGMLGNLKQFNHPRSAAMSSDPAATAAEVAALRELLDVASDLSRASLLQLLRQCHGDVAAATARLLDILTMGDHVTPGGSSDYVVDVVDDALCSDPPGDDNADEEVGGPCRGDADHHAITTPTADDRGMAPLTNVAGAGDDGVGGGAVSMPVSHRITLMHGGVRRWWSGAIPAGAATDASHPAPMFSFINEGIRLQPATDDDAWEAAGRRGVRPAPVTITLELGQLDDAAFADVLASWKDETFTSTSEEDDDDNDEDEGTSAARRFLPGRAETSGGGAAAGGAADLAAYLRQVMRESFDERQRRLDQERLDEAIALQLLLDDADADAEHRTEAMTRLEMLAARDREVKAIREEAPAEVRASVSRPKRREKGTADDLSLVGSVARRGRRRDVDKHWKRVSVSMRLPSCVTNVRIQNIVNAALQQRFEAFRVGLGRKSSDAAAIEFAYHGTTDEATKLIAQNGFIAPLKVPVSRFTHSSGNDGWYGNGIYLSPNPDVAACYSRGGMLLVCNVLRGKCYQCPGMMMGARLQSGFHSHESPDHQEWVFFESEQVLPVAIVHFGIRGYASADLRGAKVEHEVTRVPTLVLKPGVGGPGRPAVPVDDDDDADRNGGGQPTKRWQKRQQKLLATRHASSRRR